VARLVNCRPFGPGIGHETEHAKKRIARCQHQRIVLCHHEFSSTVMPGKRRTVLKVRATLALLGDEIVGHALEQKEHPVVALEHALAAVGERIERVEIRRRAVGECDPALGRAVEAGDAMNTVVLPAPFGPISAVMSLRMGRERQIH